MVLFDCRPAWADVYPNHLLAPKIKRPVLVMHVSSKGLGLSKGYIADVTQPHAKRRPRCTCQAQAKVHMRMRLPFP